MVLDESRSDLGDWFWGEHLAGSGREGRHSRVIEGPVGKPEIRVMTAGMG